MSTTWTDQHGITHLVLPIEAVLRETVYEPIRQAARNANASQREIARQIQLGGVNVKPIEVEEPETPDFRIVCRGFDWISAKEVDAPERPVTCIDCLAAT